MNGIITKSDTIHEIVDRHPELKDVLKAASPKFRNLDNPLMFNTVARVATVEQAAKIGNIYLRELLYRLNDAIGLGSEYLAAEKAAIAEGLKSGKGIAGLFANRGGAVSGGPGGAVSEPEWVADAAAFPRLDVRFDGSEPFEKVNKLADGIDSGKGFILVQSFEPAPLIRHVSGKGFDAFVDRKGPAEYWIYFRKR